MADRPLVAPVEGGPPTVETLGAIVQEHERRLSRIEERIDALYGLGWRILIGVLGAVVSPFVAQIMLHGRL
jgi:hypothetical protein